MYLQTETEARSVREAWREYIAREVSVCDGLIAPEKRGEVIRAVAAYCDELSRSGPLRSELIPQLFQRAAAKLGGDPAGEGDGGEVPELEGVADLPLPVRELHATGWFRPLGGNLRGQGRNWLLEVNRFAACRGGLELQFFCEMKDALEAVAPVWEESCGRGALALRGLRSALCGMRGSPPGASEAAGFALEIRRYCGWLMSGIACARDWSAVPDVVIRDLP